MIPCLRTFLNRLMFCFEMQMVRSLFVYSGYQEECWREIREREREKNQKHFLFHQEPLPFWSLRKQHRMVQQSSECIATVSKVSNYFIFRS